MLILKNRNIKDKRESNKYLYNIFNQTSYLKIDGNKEVLIEGCKGIVEYTQEIIRINANNMMIVFIGRGLNIKCLSDTGVVINGFISSIEFVC